MRLLNRVAYAADGTVRPNALVRAAQVFRWGALAWLLVLVLSGIPDFAHPATGPVVAAVALLWTAALSVTRPRWSVPLLVLDLALAAVLLVIDVRTGYFATIYPLAAPLTWAAVHGFRHGLLAGGLICAVLVGSHLTEGLALSPFGADAMYVISDAFTILLATSGVGVVSSLLRRSATQLRVATANELAAHEAAARLAERDSLGRAIHDSVLQSLTMVHKRGRELAAAPTVAGSEVAALAELAGAQEAALRDLLVRPEQPTPGGGASLRARLQSSAAAVRDDLDVTVSAVEDVVLPASTVDQLAAAVDQTLVNVMTHAGTRRVWVFVDVSDTGLVVSVRDDGRGFVFDPAALRRSGRMGLSSSVVGRIEDLGGTVRIHSQPGRGTEIEMSLPRPPGGMP